MLKQQNAISAAKRRTSSRKNWYVRKRIIVVLPKKSSLTENMVQVVSAMFLTLL
jgi:hypothetical protein